MIGLNLGGVSLALFDVTYDYQPFFEAIQTVFSAFTEI